MHQANVTISASLWRKILFDKAIKNTFWKYTRIYTITLLLAIVSIVVIYTFNKDRSLLVLIKWFCIFWFVIQFMTMTQIILTIRSIKEDYCFHIDLNEVGIKILEERIPWQHYEYYIENKKYIEIYNKNQQVSYLPITDDLIDIIHYMKINIKNKIN